MTTTSRLASAKLDDHQRRMQARAFSVLTDIVTEGQAAGLAPISWTLPTSGSILGQVSSLGNYDAEGIFRAWADLLGLDARRVERTDHTRWMCVAENYGGNHLVTLVLECDLFNEGGVAA